MIRDFIVNKLQSIFILNINTRLSTCCHININPTRYICKYPYESIVYRINYNRNDWIISIVLFLLLLSIALIFGNIGSLLNYKSLHPSNNICKNKYDKLSASQYPPNILSLNSGQR